MKNLLLGVALGLGLAAPAGAGYVFYYQVLGDWTVICWREMATREKACRLSAPPPSLDRTRAQNVILVHEYAPDTFQVAIEVRDIVVSGRPVFLFVDRHPVHETAVSNDLARWTGNEAKEILAEMRAGKKLVYRVHTAPEGLPRDTQTSLTTFGEALATYRQQLRVHSLLPPTD